MKEGNMNQVATTENKALSVPQQTNFDEIVTKDLQIPRILLSQATIHKRHPNLTL